MCGQNGWVFQAKNLRMGVNFLTKNLRMGHNFDIILPGNGWFASKLNKTYCSLVNFASCSIVNSLGMGLFLFIDGPALVCGWVNFPILWPNTPVQTKLKWPPGVLSPLGLFDKGVKEKVFKISRSQLESELPMKSLWNRTWHDDGTNAIVNKVDTFVDHMTASSLNKSWHVTEQMLASSWNEWLKSRN